MHDYQLTTIGNALKYYGYSFNSNDEAELAKTRELLLASAKPHLFGITSDYQPPMRNGDAWLAWPGPATPAAPRDLPEIEYVHRQGRRRDLGRFLRRAEGSAEQEGRYA